MRVETYTYTRMLSHSTPTAKPTPPRCALLYLLSTTNQPKNLPSTPRLLYPCSLLVLYCIDRTLVLRMRINLTLNFGLEELCEVVALDSLMLTDGRLNFGWLNQTELCITLLEPCIRKAKYKRLAIRQNMSGSARLCCFSNVGWAVRYNPPRNFAMYASFRLPVSRNSVASS